MSMPLDVYSKMFRKDNDDKGIQFLGTEIHIIRVGLSFNYYTNAIIV